MKTSMTARHPLRAMTLIGGIALSLSAYAGGDKAKMMDTDGDGNVSAAEHTAGAKARFVRMDANSDGVVTATEMDAGHKAMADSGRAMKDGRSSADKIKMIDTNGDGQLSAEEHAASSQAMFDKMDADNNGSVTEAEMKAGHDAMAAMSDM